MVEAETKPFVPEQSGTATSRLSSMDAFRGFVMLLMASEGLGISHIARNFPNSTIWQTLAYWTDHVEWRGCSLWDLIQPSFSFLVGVAVLYSIASRRAKGDSWGRMVRHAAQRSFILIALGILLRSIGRPQLYFTFEDTLTQIGLGYFFLFLLANRSAREQIAAIVILLFGYWLAFLLTPLPPAGFDYASVGVPADWPHLHGIAAHWDKNTNLAAGFDRWFLNLFPRESMFVYNRGGYATLSFIPTLATMLLGLQAGRLLRSDRQPTDKTRLLVLWGLAGIAAGMALDLTGICPSVKRIWTPSWALFSGGWTALLLAGFYAVIDARGRRRWAFPLIVVGMNSIAMYVIAQLLPMSVDKLLKWWGAENAVEAFAGLYEPMLMSAVELGCMWLIVWVLYRNKLFLRI